MEHKAGRTGFDIRADLIKLAVEYEFMRFNTAYGVDNSKPGAVPTIEQILETASKMNAFVSNK